MDVNVLLERGGLDEELVRVGLGIGPGRTGRFLHHVSELSRQDQLALARHRRRLDEHDVASNRRVEHAGGDADLIRLGGVLGMNLGSTQQLGDLLGADAETFELLGGDLARHLAR